MKKVMLMMAMCLGMFACGNSNAKSNKATEEQPQKDRVEVLYFHGKQRCATCMAIEKNAKEAVEAQFADELKTEQSFSSQSTFPKRRMRRLPKSMRLLGRLCSSANGKTERKRTRI